MADQYGDKQWYIVTTYSRQEARTAENIRKRIQNTSMSKDGKVTDMKDFVLRVLVAEQEEDILKDGVPTGKKKVTNLFPGCIFIEMIMTDESWYMVRNTPGVTGIIGSSGGGQKPTPVSREEIEPVLKRMGMVDEAMYDRYQVGDLVKIIHGPLEGTEGTILSIDKETGACRVKTVFFGRETPVDVEFSEIEKI
ncbi:MAG: transcription termination/antitermination protein NusG [Bacilli bacterium]|nr:transcription termination/antitermination protein NusG [Bacilli bacterium]MBQ4255993.1 transcription termination/antitermination protein NusG [Bacilli bacterium]